MAKKTVVVMGATGHIGTVVTKQLLKDGCAVRVLGRDEAKLDALHELGARRYTAAFNDAKALTQAFQGAQAAFVMIPPGYEAENFTTFQRKVGEATARALSNASVKHVVNLSSIGAHHREGTGAIVGLQRQEKRLEAIAGLRVTQLRPGYFMENLFHSIPVIKGMGVLGTPLKADLKIPMVATRDIGEKAAELLLAAKPRDNVVFEFGGPKDVTLSEAAAILGKAIGKKDLKYVQFSYADAKKGLVGSGMKADMADLMIEMNEAFNEGKLEATQELDKAHRGSTTLEEFAKGFAKAYEKA